MKEKVEAEYNASQVSAVTQGLDGTPVVLIQVHHQCIYNLSPVHSVVQSLPGVELASSNRDVANTCIVLLHLSFSPSAMAAAKLEAARQNVRHRQQGSKHKCLFTLLQPRTVLYKTAEFISM